MYLTFSKNLAGDITTISHKTTEDLVIKFDPSDFIMSTKYSYNLFSGTTILRDYTNYTLSIPNNTVSFSFDATDWETYKPTVTHPLIIQFYNKEEDFPYQLGGVAPNIAKVKAAVKTNTAQITWTSGEPTTTQVEYGLTTSYGNFTELKDDFINTHQAIIYDLVAFTTYHYRINTVDEDGVEYISNDYSFTTNP